MQEYKILVVYVYGRHPCERKPLDKERIPSHSAIISFSWKIFVVVVFFFFFFWLNNKYYLTKISLPSHKSSNLLIILVFCICFFFFFFFFLRRFPCGGIGRIIRFLVEG
jgi:hypothetical protein